MFDDLRAHLRSESHHCRKSTYLALRKAYVLTHGWSTRALTGSIRQARRGTRHAGDGLRDDLAIAPEVQAHGCAVRPRFVTPELVSEIVSYFQDQPGDAIGEEFRRTRYARLAGLDRGLKFEYDTSVTVRAPHVLGILTDDALVGAAFHYLRSEPIFAGVKAWWSLPDPDASEAERSGAAQLYHFDYDYPSFIKFFVYLTDVGLDDGPFTYIEGTHRKKPRWVDDRRSDDELLNDFGLAKREWALVGPAGTLIAADTSGYHKGAAVRGEPRLILEVEYAVSLIGRSFDGEDYPAQLRPASPFPHTFDVFCVTT